jgi:hypothetical protein
MGRAGSNALRPPAAQSISVLHRRDHAALAEQDRAADQCAVGLFLGGNKNNAVLGASGAAGAFNQYYERDLEQHVVLSAETGDRLDAAQGAAAR